MLQFTNPYDNPMREILIHFTDHKNEDRGEEICTRLLLCRYLEYWQQTQGVQH